MSGRGRTAVLLIAAAAAIVAITGAAIVLLPHRQATAAQPGGAALASAAAAGPSVVAAVPADGAGGVNGTTPIRLTVAGGWSMTGNPDTALPRISPAIPGRWRQDGGQLVFTPAAGFPQHTRVTITSQGWTSGYTTGSYSLLRLQQLLAQLGYLPLSWAADLGGAVSPADAAGQLMAAYQPPAGQFSWQRGYPRRLTMLWRPGRQNLVTTGAIMAFESVHGMRMDGQASPGLWNAVLRAAAAQQANPQGYTYAIASKLYPQTLTIWHDGRQVFRAYANTGIPVSPTADGTFPVYLRYRFQVMRGTNPDGSRYADPVQFVAYFHGGEAVHYFPRWSYGSEQSLGCVELPLEAAAQAWPYLTYGSLVTVYP